MKIGVDGVLLGAWTKSKNPLNILDIGTGSGLIASILKQRFPHANIQALEPNLIAHQQAKLNFENLPFEGEVEIHKTTLQNFKSEQLFDLIVSNPPFFKESVASGDENRDQARQSKFLPLESFLQKSGSLLSPNGTFSFVYPTQETDAIIRTANQLKLYLVSQTIVIPTPNKPSKRTLFSFSKTKRNLEIDELLIEHQRGEFSNDYKELTKDFYLNF